MNVGLMGADVLVAIGGAVFITAADDDAVVAAVAIVRFLFDS